MHSVFICCKDNHLLLALCNCSPFNPQHAVVLEVTTALHSVATSSCCHLTGCANQQVQAEAAQKEIAALQRIAKVARNEAASLQSSLQSSLQESLDRADAQQGKIGELEAQVASLHGRLQAEQVVITLTATTIHIYAQLCRLPRLYQMLLGVTPNWSDNCEHG